MKDIFSKIKSKAKQLTIDISRIGDGCTREQLYEDSLELLLDIHELETIHNQTYPVFPVSSKIPKEINSQYVEKKEDVIRKEIEKIHRKLLKWSNRQQQINAKILTLYLKLVEEGVADITEQMLMERYNNQQEFYRNFPQMKIISLKNHGKIFDVQNGIVRIWKPVLHIVEEYKKSVLGKDS